MALRHAYLRVSRSVADYSLLTGCGPPGVLAGVHDELDVRQFPPLKNYFFLGGTMASLTILATLNFTTFLAGILIASPVAGLRPIRALRSTRTRRPIPGRTNNPFFLVSRTAISA